MNNGSYLVTIALPVADSYDLSLTLNSANLINSPYTNKILVRPALA